VEPGDDGVETKAALRSQYSVRERRPLEYRPSRDHHTEGALPPLPRRQSIQPIRYLLTKHNSPLQLWNPLNSSPTGC
jgi:hypothetical protein